MSMTYNQMAAIATRDAIITDLRAALAAQQQHTAELEERIEAMTEGKGSGANNKHSAWQAWYKEKVEWLEKDDVSTYRKIMEAYLAGYQDDK